MYDLILNFLNKNSIFVTIFIWIPSFISLYFFLIDRHNSEVKQSKVQGINSSKFVSLRKNIVLAYCYITWKDKYILYIKHDYSSGTCKWILQDIEWNDLQVSRDFNNSDFALNNAKSKLWFKHPIRITEYLYEIYLHSEH